jgi:hypothetical protein
MTAAVLPIKFVLPWLVLAAVWVILALLTTVVARVARPALARIAAEQRSTLLFALALLPMIVAVLVATLAFGPGIGGVLVDTHCHAGVGCGPHVPILHTTVAHAEWFAVVLAAATVAWLWSVGGKLRRSVAAGNVLRAFATGGSAPFNIIESRERFAYCIGLLKPQLFVSRGLLDLPSAQLDAVLAHEHAHLVRRDNLRRWLAGVSLWPLPRRVRSALLEDLVAADEIACDRAACGAGGLPPLEQALAALTTAPERSGPHGRDSIGERLRALADPRQLALPPLLLATLIVVFYALWSLPVLDAAHHVTEHLLEWLD